MAKFNQQVAEYLSNQKLTEHLHGPRWNTLYKIAGPLTYRLSSTKFFSHWGSNHQNVPDNLRRLVVPDPGKVLGQADQAGAEALIVAYLCRAGRFRDLFIYGIKPHVFVALHVFSGEWKKRFPELDVEGFLNTPINQLKQRDGWKRLENAIKESDKWPPSERYYYIAKMVCHAANYGMRAPTFVVNVLQKSDGIIRLTLQQAEKFMQVYHTLFPEIRMWHMDIVDQLTRNDRTLYNLFGYPAKLTSLPWGDELFRQANAFIPQSTVGTITNIAFTEAYDWLCFNPDSSLDLLQNGHDSILFQFNYGEEELYMPFIQSLLEKELVSPRGEKFKMRSETAMGWNWGKRHKEHNPLGMDEVKFKAL